MSKPILIGYIIGAAFIIISSQLGRLFGINVSGNNSSQRIWGLLTHLDQTQWLTLGIRLALLASLLVLRRFAPKVPGGIIKA